MTDSDSVARTAIVVSAAVALLAPLLAALTQAWVGKRTEGERRRTAHDSWLRERRTDIYVELISTANELIRDARWLCELHLHPEQDPSAANAATASTDEHDPDKARALDSRVQVLASASVRHSFRVLFEKEGVLYTALGRYGASDAGRHEEVEDLLNEVAAAADNLVRVVAAELQRLPE